MRAGWLVAWFALAVGLPAAGGVASGVSPALSAALDAAGEERHAQVVATLQPALAQDPGDGAAWYNLSVALRALGDEGEAARAQAAAIRLDPAYGEGYFRLGIVYGVARPDAPGAAADAARIAACSEGGAYRVEVWPARTPIPLNELVELQVSVSLGCDADTPAEGVRLDFDAQMPAHRHGMNTTPSVTALGQGRFVIAGAQFHMPGEWRLVFDVSRAGRTERASADLTLE